MVINYDYLGFIVPTNFVPAVAVKRGELVLFILTGRKGCVGGFFKFILKNLSIT